MAQPMMTHAMARALRGGAPRIVLVRVGHPDGDGFYWSGLGSKQWLGQTWTGVGVLGQISPIKYTTALQVQDLTFTLSGVDADALAKLSSEVRGYYGRVWLACLDAQENLVRDPMSLAVVQFDTQTLQVDAERAAVIQIVGQSAFYNLTRSINEVWSNERQQRRFPGDTGLGELAGIDGKDIQWTKT